MKFISNYLLIAAFLVSSGFAHGARADQKSAYDQSQTSWKISSKNGFVVTDLAGSGKEKKTSTPEITIEKIDDHIVINGSSTASDHIRIAAVDEMSLLYKGNEYYGNLVLRCDNDRMLLLHDSPEHKHNEKIPEVVSPPEKNTVTTTNAKAYNVRVLLDEWDRHEHTSSAGNQSWHLNCEDGFIIREKNGQVLPRSSGSSLAISVKHGKFFINSIRYEGEQLLIMPVDGAIAFNENSYKGAFLVTRNQDNLLLMNSLDLEDYVFSVLRTESWPGWPLEINKVFAIACRSYAIAMIVRSKSSKLPYHIKNTNVHQTYTGLHENPIVQQAVEQTRGIFLTYDKKPVIAMFDACCGGIVPASIKDFNFTGAPYLARPYACTYCRDCKLYAWQAEYQSNALAALLKKNAPSIKKIRDIKVTKKDKAGLVQQVALRDGKDSAALSGKQIYSSLKKVKSYCFTVQKHADSIIFKGRGYGHHLGLCQWGAREMVRRGKNFRDILQFYYPKTTFMTLV